MDLQTAVQAAPTRHWNIHPEYQIWNRYLHIVTLRIPNGTHHAAWYAQISHTKSQDLKKPPGRPLEVI